MTATDPDAEANTAPLPFDEIGGAPAVRLLVERFYDLMEREPAYAALRAMHAADLTPMRESLTGFLTAWLGGPRSWFETHPGVCMMSLHRALDIDADVAGQWTDAMRRAMADTQVPPTLAMLLGDAFERMAGAMRRR